MSLDAGASSAHRIWPLLVNINIIKRENFLGEGSGSKVKLPSFFLT